MDSHSRAPKKNTSHKNEVLPQDTTHLIQRPCNQRGSPCQDPAGNWTTRRPPDHRKETQTAVVLIRLPFLRSDQNYLARHSESRTKTRQTEEEMGRQYRGMDRPVARELGLGLFVTSPFPTTRTVYLRAARSPQLGLGLSVHSSFPTTGTRSTCAQPVPPNWDWVCLCTTRSPELGLGLSVHSPFHRTGTGSVRA